MAWKGAVDVVELVVKGVALGQAIINVFHFRRIAGTPDQDGGSLNDLLQVFRGRWQTNICAYAPNNYTVTEYVASVIHGRQSNPRPMPTPRRGWEPLVLLYTDQDAVVGTALDDGLLPGDRLPTFAAGSMRWIPDRRVRWGRAGSRLLVGVEADTDTNTWNAVSNNIPAKMAAAATAMLADYPVGVGGQTAEMCVFGRRTFIRSVINQDPIFYTAKIVRGNFSPFVSSQVSRKERRRAN